MVNGFDQRLAIDDQRAVVLLFCDLLDGVQSDVGSVVGVGVESLDRAFAIRFFITADKILVLAAAGEERAGEVHADAGLANVLEESVGRQAVGAHEIDRLCFFHLFFGRFFSWLLFGRFFSWLLLRHLFFSRFFFSSRRSSWFLSSATRTRDHGKDHEKNDKE